MLSLFFKTIVSIFLTTGVQSQMNQIPVRDTSIIKYGNISFHSNRILKFSPGVFSILNYDIIPRNLRMKKGFPEGVVIPVKTKVLLFGNSPALGKIINVDSQNLEIVGVVKDVPEKSHLYCDLIILSNEMAASVETLTNIRCLIIL